MQWNTARSFVQQASVPGFCSLAGAACWKRPGRGSLPVLETHPVIRHIFDFTNVLCAAQAAAAGSKGSCPAIQSARRIDQRSDGAGTHGKYIAVFGAAFGGRGRVVTVLRTEAVSCRISSDLSLRIILGGSRFFCRSHAAPCRFVSRPDISIAGTPDRADYSGSP